MIVFIPQRLNALQISSHYSGIEKIKQKRKKLKLSKQMLQIIKKSQQDFTTLYQQTSDKELFLKVYNSIDDLTLRELKALKEFCCILRKEERPTLIQINTGVEKNNNYDKCEESIEKVIDSKTKKVYLKNMFLKEVTKK